MKKFYSTLFFVMIAIGTSAQIINQQKNRIYSNRFRENQKDTIYSKEYSIKLSGKTKPSDYQIISYQNDTTYVDTTLTIKKDYLFNYRRKDNFELLPFANMGQPSNRLAYDFDDVSLYPNMGATAKYYNFISVKDVTYYRVPTPTSELFYKTGMQQGQLLHSLLTFNTSKRFNISIAYHALHSLGNYRNALSSQGNFISTFNYKTNNLHYAIRGHIVAQDLNNDENGGLPASEILFFENGNKDFVDRARLDTNLNGDKSVLRANRYYFEQTYSFLNAKNASLKIGHILNSELTNYQYDENNTSIFFGDALTNDTHDKVQYKKLKNEAYVSFYAPKLIGNVKFNITQFNYNYSFKDTVTVNQQSLKGKNISVGGMWKAKIKKFSLKAKVASSISGDFNSNYFKASLTYHKKDKFEFKATLLSNSKSPNFNYLLYQSNYKDYNWKNDFKNIITRSILFSFSSKKLGYLNAQITQIDNFTYFSDTISIRPQPKPLQASSTLNYIKLKASKEFKIGKFALNNTLMYQNVSSGNSYFRVPAFTTRNTLYYSNYLFKGKPLFLQTGFTLKYFTSYFASQFNPLINEFNLQNTQKIGNYPILDFFINAQIQRTRIFFKIEHLNAGFTGYNYYVTPNNPYRDMVIRFGLVWNFFI